jgi:hypothetical protein
MVKAMVANPPADEHRMMTTISSNARALRRVDGARRNRLEGEVLNSDVSAKVVLARYGRRGGAEKEGGEHRRSSGLGRRLSGMVMADVGAAPRRL